MKPPQDIPDDVARLLEKREQADRRVAKPAAKPAAERRKRTRRKPQP